MNESPRFLFENIKMMHGNNNIDIGALILQRLKDNGQAVSWLAEKVNSDRSNFYRILKRKYIDTQLLMDISQTLNFDFFACFSEHFHKTNTKEK